MNLLGLITGIWLAGIFVACCLISRKALQCQRQLKKIRESVCEDGEI